MFNAVIPVHSRLHFSPAQDLFRLFPPLLHLTLVRLLFNKLFIDAEKFHADQVGQDWMYGCHAIFFHGVSYVFVAFEIIEDFFEYWAIQVLLDEINNFRVCKRPMFQNDLFDLVLKILIFNYFCVFLICVDFLRKLQFFFKLHKLQFFFKLRQQKLCNF